MGHAEFSVRRSDTRGARRCPEAERPQGFPNWVVAQSSTKNRKRRCFGLRPATLVVTLAENARAAGSL